MQEGGSDAPLDVEQHSISLLSAEVLGGETVHVHGALSGEALAHGDGVAVSRLELGNANNSEVLELAEAVADDLTGGLSLVLGLGATSLLGSVVLAESVHTESLSQVELVSHGGGTGVQPVVAVWGELLVASGLNVLGPLQ